MEKLNFAAITSEMAINDTKNFYRKFLFDVPNKEAIIKVLGPIYQEYKEIYNNHNLFNTEWVEVEDKFKNAIEGSIKEDFWKLYNDKSRIRKIEQVPPVNSDNFLLTLLRNTTLAVQNATEMSKAELEYKLNIVEVIFNTLCCYGLNLLIYKRDPAKYLRFHVVISHSISDFFVNLTYEEFNKNFAIPYVKRKEIAVPKEGKFINYSKIKKIKITTTLLKEDEIDLFGQKHGFSWTNTTKDYLAYINCCNDETGKYFPTDLTINSKDLLEHMDEVFNLLTVSPKALTLYETIVAMGDQPTLYRNILDNYRLILELVIRKVLQNEKSLENQQNEIGKYFKDKGVTDPMRFLYRNALEGYLKFQNENVKHNSNVNKVEFNNMVEVSRTLIKLTLTL